MAPTDPQQDQKEKSSTPTMTLTNLGLKFEGKSSTPATTSSTQGGANSFAITKNGKSDPIPTAEDRKPTEKNITVENLKTVSKAAPSSEFHRPGQSSGESSAAAANPLKRSFLQDIKDTFSRPETTFPRLFRQPNYLRSLVLFLAYVLYYIILIVLKQPHIYFREPFLRWFPAFFAGSVLIVGCYYVISIYFIHLIAKFLFKGRGDFRPLLLLFPYAELPNVLFSLIIFLLVLFVPLPPPMFKIFPYLGLIFAIMTAYLNIKAVAVGHNISNSSAFGALVIAFGIKFGLAILIALVI